MKLKKWLKKNKMSQSEFSKMIGVTRDMISKLINGKVKPSYQTLVKINKITNGDIGLGDF